MNYIDMFIIVLLIYAVFRGYTRGFILQLTLLAALALGIFAALKLSGFTADKLVDFISVSSESLYLISMGITFVLVFIGVNLAGKLVEKMVEAVELSFVNRLFGVIFSLGKMVIILGILLAFIDRIDQRTRIFPKYSREHSIFYKPFTTIATTIFPSLKSHGSQSGEIKEQVWMGHEWYNGS